MEGAYICSQPDGGITDELDVTATARREAELVLDDVTVVAHCRQFSIDILLLTARLVTFSESLNHIALLALVQANLDAYSLLQILLIYDEQPLFLLVLRGLWIHHLVGILAKRYF